MDSLGINMKENLTTDVNVEKAYLKCFPGKRYIVIVKSSQANDIRWFNDVI